MGLGSRLGRKAGPLSELAVNGGHCDDENTDFIASRLHRNINLLAFFTSSAVQFWSLIPKLNWNEAPIADSAPPLALRCLFLVPL